MKRNLLKQATNLKMPFQVHQEWKSYRLQNPFFIQSMFHLLQLHHLQVWGKSPELNVVQIKIINLS